MIELELRTVDIQNDGNRWHHAGINVFARCEIEPNLNMMVKAVDEVMCCLTYSDDTSIVINPNHDIDVDIFPLDNTNQVEFHGINCSETVSKELFREKLLAGLRDEEWFKSLKTGHCKCEFLLDFRN